MPQCFDSSGAFIDCASATATSTCFDDNAQEVDCSSYSQAANAVGSQPAPAQVTGALAAGSVGGYTGLTAAITKLGTVAATTYAQVANAPRNNVRVGPTGVAVPQSTITGGLLLAIAAVVAFLLYRNMK